MTQVIPVEIGCQPSPSGSGELIVQDCESTFVVFIAIDTKKSVRGYLEDKGIAVVECLGSCQTKHGYPNDDGRDEHPLFNFGLSRVHGISEVENSPWVTEVAKQMTETTRRIWGTPETKKQRKLRHFIFKFKESTFECIASDLTVSFHTEPYTEVVKKLLQKVSS
ncbi:MAG: hypothetical protein HY308_02370 [Gammaproteobacteria bacterium]|nr:hypothetical protein [Gammaproteobacteria bacterium]